MQQAVRQTNPSQFSRLQPASGEARAGSMFDSLESLECDQEEEVMKSWASGTEDVKEAAPVQKEVADLHAKHFSRIRCDFARSCC